MSDFARLLEMALANDPETARAVVGVPGPSLTEQMAANEAAVAQANKGDPKPAETKPAAHQTEHRSPAEREQARRS